MTELYEDIYEYLETVDKQAVTEKDLDELIHKIYAYTDLDKKVCGIILKTIFQEIKNAMLRGECVSIYKFGKFLISGNHTDGKEYVVARFLPSSKLMGKIDNGR